MIGLLGQVYNVLVTAFIQHTYLSLARSGKWFYLLRFCYRLWYVYITA